MRLHVPLALAAALLLPAPAPAAVGDLLAAVDLPSQAYFTGVAADCAGNLYVLHWDGLRTTGKLARFDRFGRILAVADTTDAASGELVQFQEVAWDQRRRVLWGVERFSSGNRVWRIDPTSGRATSAFSLLAPACWHSEKYGIAWDPSDDTLWVPQITDWQQPEPINAECARIWHNRTDGTPIGEIVLTDASGTWPFGIGGIVTGEADRLYVAQILRDGNGGALHQFARGTGGHVREVVPLPPLPFGIDCDPVNFAPRSAIWVHAWDNALGQNRLLAYEAEPDACLAMCGTCPDPPEARAADVVACGGAPVTLDASASTGCATAGREYRWRDGASVICNWSRSPDCALASPATAAYTLEVRCVGSAWCGASATVLVILDPDLTPGDHGNTLRAVRRDLEVDLGWADGVPAAYAYTLHRSEVRGSWPSPPALRGLTAATTTLPDVSPPPPLLFYRVAGTSCSGQEGD